MDLSSPKHHSFSPSKLERIEACPPSWKICKDFVQIDSKDSSRGTLMHRAFYEDAALQELSDADKDTVLAIRKEYLEPFKKIDGMKFYNEIPVIVHDADGTELTAGTLDFLMITPDGKTGNLIDLKFGNYEVTPAENNFQIQAYVCGVFERFPELENLFAIIVQPVFGIGNYDGQTVFTRGNVPSMLDRIRKAVNSAQSADLNDLNQYHVSAENCRYCNKFSCRKYREWMRSNMELVGVQELPEDVSIMTLEYADTVKLAGKAIEEQIKSVTSLADKVIIESGGSQNYRVCEGRTTKKTDWKALCEKHGITESDIEEFTTESAGKPYVTARMRKSTKKLEGN